AGTGATGERFKNEDHVYSGDLDLFGRGGLFELLSAARTPMGENRLAAWLLGPSATEAILDRHNSVNTLRGKIDLRENLALIGEDLRATLNPETLVSWAETPPTMRMAFFRGIGVALGLCAVAALVYLLETAILWPLIVVLAVEMIVLRFLQPAAVEVLTGVDCNADGLILFSKILARLEREQFDSPQLQKFAEMLKSGERPASRAVRKIARIVYWSDARTSLLGSILNLPLLYTLQLGYAADAWRGRWGGRMRLWVDATAELEALLSLATYSYEHPNDPFPEIMVNGEIAAIFDGEELGHPLIPAAQCVRNSARLNREKPLILVSGSNMSGKSTFLRTVGINTVLAMAGAPVRGKRLRLTPLTLGTRIRTSDSLQEGRSNFYAEILRIRAVFELAADRFKLLFLFDELLEGTNSKDRRIGAEGLIRALLARGAIGIVSTHDLALTEMTDALNQSVWNAHFQDYVEDGKMRFDYKLREGVVAKSNALELMRLVGLKV
ncbi:MAG: MutS-related protein, partial [Candidatus Acidiferrales bacterium]